MNLGSLANISELIVELEILKSTGGILVVFPSSLVVLFNTTAWNFFLKISLHMETTTLKYVCVRGKKRVIRP